MSRKIKKKVSTPSQFTPTYVYFLNRFGIRMFANVQQRLSLKSSVLLKKNCSRLENGSKFTAKIEIVTPFVADF